MHLAFENRELRDICLSEIAAADAFGVETSKLLLAQLADMVAAETLAELVTGNLRADPINGAGTYVVNVGQCAQLRFRANHPRARIRNEDLTDPNRVSRVIVISMELA